MLTCDESGVVLSAAYFLNNGVEANEFGESVALAGPGINAELSAHVI